MANTEGDSRAGGKQLPAPGKWEFWPAHPRLAQPQGAAHLRQHCPKVGSVNSAGILHPVQAAKKGIKLSSCTREEPENSPGAGCALGDRKGLGVWISSAVTAALSFHKLQSIPLVISDCREENNCHTSPFILSFAIL